MKNHKIALVLVVFISIFSACTKAIIDESNTNPINRIITYEGDIELIMFNHCITCHAGTTPLGDLDLTTYDNVRFTTESANLLQRINNLDNPMPPSGLLSEENRLIIEKWTTDGFLEN